jgi:organic radical activating enzyme
VQVEDVSFIELELSSYCNARCPGCPRTQIEMGFFPIEEINKDNHTLENIKRIFDDERLKLDSVKFCGNLGDPMMNPEVYEITAYFLNKGWSVKINTNGGLGSEELWARLGQLRIDYGKKFKVVFAIDGLEDTNHIYRVNVKWDKLIGNIKAFLQAGGQGEWHFIIFDHNEGEVEKARKYSKQLGMPFFTRKSTRNIVTHVNKNNQRVSASDSNSHKHASEYREVKGLIKKFEKQQSSAHSGLQGGQSIRAAEVFSATEFEKIKVLSDSIDCWYLHKSQLFLDANMRLWPCCHFADMFAKGVSKAFDRSLPEDHDWNNLKVKNIADVIDHPFYQRLEERWKLESQNLTTRCLTACGDKGKFKSTIERVRANQQKEATQ